MIINILKSKPLQKVLNPGYNKVTKVEEGNICIILSVTNKLGDLIIHNFLVQQMALYGYSMSYAISEPFHATFRNFFDNHCMAEKKWVLPNNIFQWPRFIIALRNAKIKAVIVDEYPQISSVFFYLAGVPVILNPQGTKLAFHSQEYKIEKLKLHYTELVFVLVNLLSKTHAFKTHRIAPYFPFRRVHVKALAEGGDSSLTLHIGGGNYWNRRWPMEKYVEMGKRFLENYDDKIYLVGGREEYEANEQIKEALKKYSSQGRVVNFCGVDLHTTATIISATGLFIGNDSGLLHMAVGLNRRVIGIYGPSPIQVVNPTRYDKRNGTVHASLDCVPCLQRECKLPDAQKFSCLTEISVDNVWKQVQLAMPVGVR